MALPRQPLSLKARALGYLSRREHSRAELRRKLAPHAESADEVEALLDWLEGENWLSNARFAESVVHRRAGRYGTARLMQELKTHQLDDQALGEVKAQLQASEAARAKAVWERRFGRPPVDMAERAKQVRFMVARGFSRAVVSRIIQGADELLDDGDELA
ncbi:recombination regulator RecX [Ralstonia solanacearum]|uniref:Regulatory protein RecX n=1 Tax=Ralstonia solanacearum K60 TaxID=1091042 RepID=A0AAP7ZLF8_RALSL|nr:recombination regulator RecX [Ralstonia solanacearum]AST31221.2 recombination regulator RecX [Ralstonia solanacearum]AYB52445.2 recombination regulator RecX [Ralstonia solanacearum]AYB57007.2 recombination regulator RecX [Ralstonia solanacearum]MBT1537253.1 recombination regulator RecX [Ralstonia solanacearum]MDB0508479.1 recombination regulator RecX [Ralstonia solanacearum]